MHSPNGREIMADYNEKASAIMNEKEVIRTLHVADVFGFCGFGRTQTINELPMDSFKSVQKLAS